MTAAATPAPRPEPAELDAVALANQRAKGKRPFFLDDPAVERVLSVAMAIAGELSVARERIDTLERLLVQRGVLQADDIERYVPDAAVQAARNEWGRAYIARVLRILDQDVQAMSGAPEPSMEQVAEELGRAG
jgi:polyhydroxyalkanoate synthesis regulator phasin